MAKTILITGASSGIGRAVALEMARRGYSLALTARRLDLLGGVKEEVLQACPGIAVEVRSLDVVDHEAVFATINELDRLMGGLDIVFANAGIGLKETVGKGQFDASRKNIAVNLLGAMATVDAAMAHFLERGRGHVVGNCSVAAFRGMARNASYGASKAGFANYLEAVQVEVHGTGIDVTILYPGFVSTDLLDNAHRRPFLSSPEKVARITVDKIEKRVKASTIPVFPWSLIGRLLRILPVPLVAKL